MTIDPIVDPDLQLLRKQFAELSSFQTFTLDAHQFSDGLHLLQIWQLWQEIRPENSSRLHIISSANQPLSCQEVAQKLLKFPDLSNFATRLLAQYPPAISGVHRLIFYDERLTIDLWFGDVLNDLNIENLNMTDLNRDHLNQSISPIPLAPSPKNLPTFAVIGAGIAGLSVTHALTQRGYAVTLIEQNEPLAGASGNPCALLLSKLPKLNRVSGNLQTMGALTTVRWWQNWANDVVISKGALLQIAEDDLEKISGYPADVVELINATEASKNANIQCSNDFMFMPQAAGINPQAIRQHVLSSPLVTVIKAQAKQLVQTQDKSAWQVFDGITLDGKANPIAQASKVIVANAKDCVTLCTTLPPLTIIRGQISWLPLPSNSPTLTLGYGGYVATFQQHLLLGSSFVRDDECLEIRKTEHESNLALLKNSFSQLAAQLPPTTTWQGRVSLRALPRDSMPIVGSVPDMNNVFVLAGLGSKGFSFAPLCAELVVAQILGEALPMTDQLAAAIRPDRFIKKERVRKPYYTPTKDH